MRISSKSAKNYGIEPLVTITHFDCPIHLLKNMEDGKIAN